MQTSVMTATLSFSLYPGIADNLAPFCYARRDGGGKFIRRVGDNFRTYFPQAFHDFWRGQRLGQLVM